IRIARSPAIPRTAGSWVAVVGTRSSNRSARRPSCARAPLESTIRRPLLRRRRPGVGSRPSILPDPFRIRRGHVRGYRPVPNLAPLPGTVHPRNVAVAIAHGRCRRGCRGTGAGIGWSEMNSRPPGASPLPGIDGGEGADVLVAAMETAPAAIYVLSAASDEPVWANARARSLGASPDGMPVVDGRPVAEVLRSVLRSGLPETICGPLGTGGPASTLMVRPLRVGDGPGALVILESDEAATDTSLWPKRPDSVEQAQLSLLPPS